MAAKQNLPRSNEDRCPIDSYQIYTYSSFLETFVTLFRASMGGYDVSARRSAASLSQLLAV